MTNDIFYNFYKPLKSSRGLQEIKWRSFYFNRPKTGVSHKLDEIYEHGRGVCDAIGTLRSTGFQTATTKFVFSRDSALHFLGSRLPSRLGKELIHSLIHLFCKKQLTERNCTIKLENWLNTTTVQTYNYR